MIFLGKELIPHKSISIVAEISCNHEGSILQAVSLITEAKNAGADAVKIQCYATEEMTINYRSYLGPQNNYEMHNEFYIKDGIWTGWHLYDLYSKTHTPLEWIPLLFAHAAIVNIPIFASVFGEKSLAALEAVNCPAYKIASFELNDTNLIKMVAATGKPIVLSTGVATIDEIDRAVQEIEKHYGDNYIVMHCVSKYPAKLCEMQLSKISEYGRLYDDPVGFSDHTLTSTAAQLAITLGATVIEKHLCLTGTSEDAKFSLRPDEFKQFVQDCNNTLKALEIRNEEPDIQFKRSLYVVKDMKMGDKFTTENVKSIRPGYGLDPHCLSSVLRCISTTNLETGTALKKEHLK